MKEYSEAFVVFDTAKEKHAVAIADTGRDGEVRYFGEIASSPNGVAQFVKKLASRCQKLLFCYEASQALQDSADTIRFCPHLERWNHFALTASPCDGYPVGDREFVRGSD